MPSLRLQRVRELLKRTIGEVIHREFPVSEAGLISVANQVALQFGVHKGMSVQDAAKKFLALK